MRSKTLPILAILEQMEDVVLVMEEEAFVIRLFDLDKAAHGEIDDGRCNISRVYLVVEQGSAFRGRNTGRRIIHGSDGHAGVGIAAFVPPQRKHHGERDQRQENRGVAADEPEEFSEPSRLFEDAFGNVNIDGEAAAHGQGIVGLELDDRSHLLSRLRRAQSSRRRR